MDTPNQSPQKAKQFVIIILALSFLGTGSYLLYTIATKWRSNPFTAQKVRMADEFAKKSSDRPPLDAPLKNEVTDNSLQARINPLTNDIGPANATDAQKTKEPAFLEEQLEEPESTLSAETSIFNYSQAENIPGSNAVTGVLTTDIPEKAAVQHPDELIGIEFINSMAKLLVDNYIVGTGSIAPTTRLTPKYLNAYYGTKLIGFSSQNPLIEATRKRVIQYALDDAMLEHLYFLYEGPLLQQISLQSHAKKLSTIDTALLYYVYADKLKSLSGIVRAYTQIADIDKLIYDIDASLHESLQINMQYLVALEKQKQDAEKVFYLSNQYLQSIYQHEHAKYRFISAIRLQTDSQSFSTDDIIYICKWLKRHREFEVAYPKLSSLLSELGKSFENKAKDAAPRVAYIRQAVEGDTFRLQSSKKDIEQRKNSAKANSKPRQDNAEPIETVNGQKLNVLQPSKQDNRIKKQEAPQKASSLPSFSNSAEQ